MFVALVFLPGLVAGLGWLVAAASALELALRHPLEGRDLFWYGMRGYAFLDPEQFAETGREAHRRMMLGAGSFLFGAMAAVVVGVMVSG